MQKSSVQWHLDRNLPISLNEQIKGQIVFAIVYGELKPETPLPSVREMASILKVSTMTITGVYRELVKDGLIVSLPRVGYFVAPTDSINGSIHSRTTYNHLRQIVDNCIRQALLLGHSIDDVSEVFNSIIKSYYPGMKQDFIILAGNFQQATDDYAIEIEEILSESNVKVIPVLISEIIEKKPQVIDIIRKSTLIMTIASRLLEVRTLLEPYEIRVAAVAFHLHPTTRQKLSNISHDKLAGVVTTFPEFLQTMVDQVVSYSHTKNPPICAVLGQNDRIREMMMEIDVLIYASGSESVLKQVPEDVDTIEFRHTPESESVRRLLPVLSKRTLENEDYPT